MSEKIHCTFSPCMSTVQCNFDYEKHKLSSSYRYQHDKKAESAFFVKGPTIVSCNLEHERNCSDNGPLNTQLDKFDCNDSDELRECRVDKNIFEAAELPVHIRPE